MKRLATSAIAAALVAAALAPSASARIVEMGSGVPAAKSSCPGNPCEVVGRVTGYQGRSEGIKNPFIAPSDGAVVAFTVTLSQLEQNQVEYFTNLYGSPPQVRLSILRKSKKRKTRLEHRLLRETRAFQVARFFGSSPTFALPTPLRAARGDIIALTVPTWAPAFARDLGRTNWWRSSRRKGDCDNVTQNADFGAEGKIKTFGCTYTTARLLYTATFIPDPSPTDNQPARRRR